MRQLQNNFTTPEQSKRLLELGVPADSADFHYIGRIENCIYYNQGKTISEIQSMSGNNLAYPCWSVGRLIEIIMRCHKYGILFFSSIRIYKTDILNNTLIDYLMEYMPDMDFSKLEE